MSKDLAVQEPKSEIVLASEKIKTGLAAFEERKAELNILKVEVDGLDITSVEDKAGIKQVTEGRKKLKNARVEIEKEGKSMRDPLTALAKTISAKEKELVDIIEPTEKKLMEKEKWVKNEQDRIEREAEEKEKARIQARIDSLAAYGFQIDYNMVVALNDEDFSRIVENARVEYEKEQKIKSEKEESERKQREQDEKDRKELQALRDKQAEADRIIREQQEELERKEAKIKRQEEEQEAEAQRIKALADDRLWRGRLEQLEEIGFNGQFAFPKWEWDRQDDFVVITREQLLSLTDAEFNEIKEKHNLQAAGVKDQRRILEEKTKQEEAERKEAELNRVRQEAAVKALQEKKEKEDEAKRLEEERLQQATDKDKFAVLIFYLENLPAIEPKSAKHKKLYAEVKELNAKVIAHIKAKS